jgi:glycosyltransferase involved in cell wall biosynthesis
MADLRISVVICCYSVDRLPDVREAVTSVRAQTHPPYELIVAVDHTPEVYARLQAELPPSVRVVLNDGIRGLSETRNVDIRASAGEVIAFIDDDAVAAPDWLDSLAGHYRDERVVAVGGTALPIWVDAPRPAWFPQELDWVVGCTHQGPPAAGNEVRNMIGCNMSFRKEAFAAAGLFSTSVGRVGKVQGMGEDTEICMRVKHTLPQRLILFAPEAVISHKVPAWRATAKYLMRRSYNEGLFKNTVRVLARRLSSATSAPESSYLRHLLLAAIPRRLKRAHKKGSVSQSLAILLCVACVGAGYVRGLMSTARVSGPTRET